MATMTVGAVFIDPAMVAADLIREHSHDDAIADAQSKIQRSDFAGARNVLQARYGVVQGVALLTELLKGDQAIHPWRYPPASSGSSVGASSATTGSKNGTFVATLAVALGAAFLLLRNTNAR